MNQTLKKTKYVLAPPREGEILEGTVVFKDNKSLIIDLKPFGTGIIRGKEYKSAKEQIKKIKVGDKISVKLIELENEDGLKELSIKEVDEEMFWRDIEEKKEKNKFFKVEISGANQGGLLVNLKYAVAFLPSSQLLPEHYPKVEGGDKQEILKHLLMFKNKTLKVRILHFNKRENKIILTEKAKN